MKISINECTIEIPLKRFTTGQSIREQKSLRVRGIQIPMLQSELQILLSDLWMRKKLNEGNGQGICTIFEKHAQIGRTNFIIITLERGRSEKNGALKVDILWKKNTQL